MQLLASEVSADCYSILLFILRILIVIICSDVSVRRLKLNRNPVVLIILSVGCEGTSFRLIHPPHQLRLKCCVLFVVVV